MRTIRVAIIAYMTIMVIQAKAYQAKPNITVTAAIKGMPVGQWVYYKPSSNRWLDSVQTTAQGFTIHLYIPPGQGDMFNFYLSKNVVTQGNNMKVYLDPPCQLRVTADNGNFSNVRFSGTGRGIEEQNDYYRRVPIGFPLKPSGAIDTVALRQWPVIRKQWIKEHSSSPVSAALLLSEWSPNTFPLDTLKKYVSMLTADAKNNYPGKQLSVLITRLQQAAVQSSITKLDTSSVLAIGRLAPGFTQADTAGRPVSLQDFHGKYVLLNFWGSWCHWCRLENPKIIAGFDQYKNKNFTVISVGTENSLDKWIKAIHEDQVGRWTHLSDLSQNGNAVARLYKVTAYPTSLLIGPDGTLLYRGMGASAVDTVFKEMLPKRLN